MGIQETFSRKEVVNLLQQQKRIFEQFYVRKTSKFTVGQEIWVNGEEATYLFPNNNPGVSSNNHYVVFTRNWLGGSEIICCSENNIVVTKPKPKIKPGTVVLCWDEGAEKEDKAVTLFIGYESEKARVGDYVDGKEPTFLYDHVEIYKQ